MAQTQWSLQTSYSYRPSATSQLFWSLSHCCVRRPPGCSSRCCTGAHQSELVHIPKLLTVFQSLRAIPSYPLARQDCFDAWSANESNRHRHRGAADPPARPQGPPGHHAGRAGGITGCSKAPQMLSHQACCILEGYFCSAARGREIMAREALSHFCNRKAQSVLLSV